VRYDGSTWPLDERRPLILAAPHYGATAVGFLAAVHRMHRRRPVNVFFDAETANRQIARLLDFSGIDVAQLHDGFAGSIEALRALRRRECVIMMPDVCDDDARTLVVPFYGRLLRVAAGTAFLALRSNALVVPVFATVGNRLSLDVRVDTAIDARRFSGDESQKIFMLTHALFSRFESVFRCEPEHWHGWETFPKISTAIDPAYRLDYDEPLQVLRAKCEGLPHLLQEIPELDLICR
jgi:lauroyl/myristoyl acyltransferase